MHVENEKENLSFITEVSSAHASAKHHKPGINVASLEEESKKVPIRQHAHAYGNQLLANFPEEDSIFDKDGIEGLEKKESSATPAFRKELGD